MCRVCRIIPAVVLVAAATVRAEQAPVDAETDEAAVPDKLEEQPTVDELPEWLINIPPEESGALPQGTPPRPVHYVNEDKHVVSQSRMFSVSGGDALRMGAIATHADELRSQFDRLLGCSGEPWKYAVSIRLLGNTADAPHPNPIRTGLRIIGSEPNLQVRIYAGGGIDLTRLDAAITGMLLYEYALRKVQPNALPEKLQMPPWLMAGIRRAVLWQEGRGDRREYAHLLSKGEMMSPESIVNIPDPEELDTASRRLYEVSCGVLVLGLLHQDGGSERMRALISESLLQEPGNVREMISTYFHEMGAEGSTFAKWWALELAALAQNDAAELLTPAETEKQLADALIFTRTEGESHLPVTLSLDTPEKLKDLPELGTQLQRCIGRLSELNLRAFPGYRAVIAEYVQAAAALSRGAGMAEIHKIIDPLQQLRRAYAESAVRGRDYLDWFEITQLGALGGTDFESYRQALRVMQQDANGPDTPISRYLDDIEALHSLRSGAPLPPSMQSHLSSPEKHE